MKIRDLILFIEHNDIEWHWFDTFKNKNVIIFVNDYQLEDFRHVLHSSDYNDEGIEIVLKDNYFCVKMADLCENNDIDICDVFDVNKKN